MIVLKRLRNYKTARAKERGKKGKKEGDFIDENILTLACPTGVGISNSAEPRISTYLVVDLRRLVSLATSLTTKRSTLFFFFW